MTRYYLFNWYETKSAKYGKPLTRTSKINLQHPCGKVEFDAKKAVELFVRAYGSLNKNSIISIKEFDENGQIGEDIIPQEGSSIVPTKRA